VELAYVFRNPADGAIGAATFENRIHPGSATRSGIVPMVTGILVVPLPLALPVRLIVGGGTPSTDVAPVKSQVPVRGTLLVIAIELPVVNCTGALNTSAANNDLADKKNKTIIFQSHGCFSSASTSEFVPENDVPPLKLRPSLVCVVELNPAEVPTMMPVPAAPVLVKPVAARW
jgi:hypothetical protein